MNQTRLNLINRAFQKLDKTRDGKITCEDLANVYNVKQHPKFQNGELTEQQVLAQFLDSFEVSQHKDGIVSFIQYYFYNKNKNSRI
jgi:Ca2+-binding EF-hand superfamily protein